ncbi:hypothetical protein AOQ84DRAFT_420697 [Glonium stellatum]|uniref:AIG1-type G domain-containing protein n=1 Tax=Glonium stellatum TaxID=574774 RepID=A0A8E2F8R6_9PEZI|nr:hypothetical protein AOQ84DRAFT_420697 [Glonium stellatum]
MADDESDGDCMIFIMGITGSGKSHFINKIIENGAIEQPGLQSGTQHCQLVKGKLDENTSFALVDTPGFDDTTRSDGEILEHITRFLVVQHQLGIRLKGIIYLHRITDNRIQGSTLKNFQMFQRLCGNAAFGNVILVTTMWDLLDDQTTGYQREQELREQFWGLMEDHGSYIDRFDGNPKTAEALVMTLLSKDDVLLNIQVELDRGLRLDETSAGSIVAVSLEEELRDSKKQMERIDESIAGAVRGRNRTTKKYLERQMQEAKSRFQQYSRVRERLRAKVSEEVAEDIDQKKKSSRSPAALTIFMAVLGLCNVVCNILSFVGF